MQPAKMLGAYVRKRKRTPLMTRFSTMEPAANACADESNPRTISASNTAPTTSSSDQISAETPVKALKPRCITRLAWLQGPAIDSAAARPTLLSVGGATLQLGQVNEMDRLSTCSSINLACTRTGCLSWSIAVDASSRQCIVGSDDGLLDMIDIQTEKLVQSSRRRFTTPEPIGAVQWQPSHNRVCIVGGGRRTGITLVDTRLPNSLDIHGSFEDPSTSKAARAGHVFFERGSVPGPVMDLCWLGSDGREVAVACSTPHQNQYGKAITIYDSRMVR